MEKPNHYRNQTVEELQLTLDESVRELYNLKNKKIVEKVLEKPHQRKFLRRNIARLKTILQEKNNQVKCKG